jgi:hypothetical protein
VQEPKLQENLKSRGYNIDLRTAEADVNKLVKDEINKYSRFTPEDLGWKAHRPAISRLSGLKHPLSLLREKLRRSDN